MSRVFRHLSIVLAVGLWGNVHPHASAAPNLIADGNFTVGAPDFAGSPWANGGFGTRGNAPSAYVLPGPGAGVISSFDTFGTFGSYYAGELGVNQDVTTTPGATYELSFFCIGRNSGTPSLLNDLEVSVDFDEVSVPGSVVNAALIDQYFDYYVTANSSISNIGIELQVSSNVMNGGVEEIYDVSLTPTAVPELGNTFSISSWGLVFFGVLSLQGGTSRNGKIVS